jgi:hypothetical protein
VDNNAIADGFQIYLHTFVLTADGSGRDPAGAERTTGTARRYHWHSARSGLHLRAAHGIVGPPAGVIQNLVDADARAAQRAMLAADD